MDMRVMVQVLSPGVEHQEHADDRTEALGVGGHVAQRGGGAAHQQIIEDSRVGEGEVSDGGREREHHVMVFDRQEVLRLLVEPAGAGQGLALGTMAVAAGVVSDAFVTAVEAVLDVPAQDGGAAIPSWRS